MSEVPEYLSDWITAQRWYGGKGRSPRFERIGGFDLDDPTGEARITIHLLLDRSAPAALYQVPLTERTARFPAIDHALIEITEDERGVIYLYDGPHDPACASAILRLILDEGSVRPDELGVPARGRPASADPPLSIRSSRVLSGEQSNTSIIFDTETRDGHPGVPVICKLFRTLHNGENPDVVLLDALTGAGSTVVPRSIGHIDGQWRDHGEPSGVAFGHLAFAQEFLPGVQDAWRVALRAAEDGEDFTDRARTLGEATADVHTTLAAALPTREATAAGISGVIASMRQRFEQAAAEVPSIEHHREALRAVYERAEASVWPPMQRIHGDYHLGQVLAVPDRGWVVLDFEGEPMRPMSERSMEDSPLRDVAGMLRSFDYVAGSVSRSRPGVPVADWASAARRAFLDGYIARSGLDLRANRSLLDAFEIDKALYEAVYEARNRPNWLSIPTAAIERLVERATATA
ncbi:MAG: phosphotransferase [Microbacteriaceae bacterium]|nr:phosphotransferase [Microbacteriaceae bacterium]HEV7955570.1 phosphotransferase [Marisediminicola sp.]